MTIEEKITIAKYFLFNYTTQPFKDFKKWNKTDFLEYFNLLLDDYTSWEILEEYEILKNKITQEQIKEVFGND